MFNYLLFDVNPLILIFIWITLGFLFCASIYFIVKGFRYLRKYCSGLLFLLMTKRANLSVCGKCFGYGIRKNRAGQGWACDACNGKGTLEWTEKIKNGDS